VADGLRTAPRRTPLGRFSDATLDILGAVARVNWIVAIANSGKPPPQPRQYVKHTRLVMAETLAKLGVALPPALSWIEANQAEVRPLAQHLYRLSSDVALQLCAMITTIFHATPREGSPPIEAIPYRA
jgi:hypothetical protein